MTDNERADFQEQLAAVRAAWQRYDDAGSPSRRMGALADWVSCLHAVPHLQLRPPALLEEAPKGVLLLVADGLLLYWLPEKASFGDLVSAQTQAASYRHLYPKARVVGVASEQEQERLRRFMLLCGDEFVLEAPARLAELISAAGQGIPPKIHQE